MSTSANDMPADPAAVEAGEPTYKSFDEWREANDKAITAFACADGTRKMHAKKDLKEVLLNICKRRLFTIGKPQTRDLPSQQGFHSYLAADNGHMYDEVSRPLRPRSHRAPPLPPQNWKCPVELVLSMGDNIGRSMRRRTVTCA